jgi:hypothetical protein
MAVVGAGLIGAGQAEYLDVMLEGGHPYSINDQNGILVSWDETPAADAYGAVTPIITGPFRIVVNAVKGTAAYQVEIFG